MFARVSAFVVWALVAAAAVFWALRLLARPLPVPPYTVTAANDQLLAAGDVSRLLGAPPVAEAAQAAAPALASRFRLVGVMAPPAGKRSDAGLALLAVDGKPARAFRTGAAVDGDLVLQSVGLRTAALGPARGAPLLTLEVPRLPAAATGSLPPGASMVGLPGAAVVPPPPPGPGPGGLPTGIPPLPPGSQDDSQEALPVLAPQPAQRPRAVQ